MFQPLCSTLTINSKTIYAAYGYLSTAHALVVAVPADACPKEVLLSSMHTILSTLGFLFGACENEVSEY